MGKTIPRCLSVRGGFGINPIGLVTMSEQNQTIIVYRNDVIIAAYGQYCEGNGGTHALVFNEETNSLSYTPGGSYYDNDRISAAEIMTIDFSKDADSPFEAVEYTEVVADTVDFHGTTYNLEVVNNEPIRSL
jgi:hypothetical protein